MRLDEAEARERKLEAGLQNNQHMASDLMAKLDMSKKQEEVITGPGSIYHWPQEYLCFSQSYIFFSPSTHPLLQIVSSELASSHSRAATLAAEREGLWGEVQALTSELGKARVVEAGLRDEVGTLQTQLAEAQGALRESSLRMTQQVVPDSEEKCQGIRVHEVVKSKSPTQNFPTHQMPNTRRHEERPCSLGCGMSWPWCREIWP